MQKKKIEININDFPSEIHDFLKETDVYDSSSNPEMKVYYSDLGYYIKTAEKGQLTMEAEMTRLFNTMGIGAEVVSYLSLDKDYMVTKRARGENCFNYLNNPERLCEELAKAMKLLHSKPIGNVPVSLAMELYYNSQYSHLLKKDTFIHGDFCLPNILLDDWTFSTFIDLGLAGVGDRHIDIYWVLWSLNYNLKTDKYTDYFLDLYGKENFDRKILKIVAEMEDMCR